jgi:hypothetical protein
MPAIHLFSHRGHSKLWVTDRLTIEVWVDGGSVTAKDSWETAMCDKETL